jgi:hypothetical protein
MLGLLLRLFAQACEYNKAEIVILFEEATFLDFLIVNARKGYRPAIL